MKKAGLFIYLFIFFMIFTTSAFSADTVTVAILDLAPKGVPQIVAKAITDIIRSEFVNIANFTVVERSQINAILEEQGLQMTGCTDSACAVQFGKILSAKRIVVGEVNKVGNSIIITARYVDVQSAKSLFSATSKANDIDTVDEAAKVLAKDLATKIVTGDKEVITPKTLGGFYTRSIIPGWGQFYAGNNGRGFVYSGLFGAACIASGYFVYDFFAKKSDYDGLEKGTPKTEFQTARDDYKKASLYANISFGVVGAVYIVHWIDALFFSRSDFDKLFVMEQSESSFFIGNSNGSQYKKSDFIMGYSYKF